MNCRDCILAKTRTNIVEGCGNKNARVMFIGEAPGRTEDDLGTPFVGGAGKILDTILEKVHLNREDVYITNVVKCRPPSNRNPTNEEIKACSKHLDKEIKEVNPDIIVPLGVFATRYIFDKYNIEYTSMSNARGKKYSINGLKIVPLYHPASLIYNKNLQDKMFKDVELINTW